MKDTISQIYENEKFIVNKEEMKAHAIFALAFGLVDVAAAIRESKEEEDET